MANLFIVGGNRAIAVKVEGSESSLPSASSVPTYKRVANDVLDLGKESYNMSQVVVCGECQAD